MMFQEQISAVKLLPFSKNTFRQRKNEPDLIFHQIHLKKGGNHPLPFFTFFTGAFVRGMFQFRSVTFRQTGIICLSQSLMSRKKNIVGMIFRRRGMIAGTEQTRSHDSRITLVLEQNAESHKRYGKH